MARICRLTPKTFGYMLLPFLFPAFGLATMYMFCRPSAGRPCDSVDAIFLDSQRAFTSARLEHWLVVSVGIVAFAIAMEFYARYAHRGAWHGWLYRPVHSTHHSAKTAEDVFEMNDLFGVFSFVVVFPFIAYAQTRVDSWGGAACFGAAVGISVFGTAVRICRSNNVNFNYLLCSFYSMTEYFIILILLLHEYMIERLVVHTLPTPPILTFLDALFQYMVVHDGVHHRRFGGCAWLRRVACIGRAADAHALHHDSKMGPPYGLFLGPHEVEAMRAGREPRPMPKALTGVLIAYAATSVVGLAAGV